MTAHRFFAYAVLPMLFGILATISVAAQSPAQDAGLGSVRFPTSAQSQEAQGHFLRGLAALHSFCVWS